MKRLFLVLGSNSGDAAAWTCNLRPSKDKHNGIIVFTYEDTSHKALEKTLGAIRICGDSDYNNMVVAYFGDNLHLLKANLPCPSLDLYLLAEKLKEAVGGFDSPRDIKLVLDLLTGGLQRFLTEDEAPLVGDEREVWTYVHSE
jgi:hypothetical protein